MGAARRRVWGGLPRPHLDVGASTVSCQIVAPSCLLNLFLKHAIKELSGSPIASFLARTWYQGLQAWQVKLHLFKSVVLGKAAAKLKKDINISLKASAF